MTNRHTVRPKISATNGKRTLMSINLLTNERIQRNSVVTFSSVPKKYHVHLHLRPINGGLYLLRHALLPSLVNGDWTITIHTNPIGFSFNWKRLESTSIKILALNYIIHNINVVAVTTAD